MRDRFVEAIASATLIGCLAAAGVLMPSITRQRQELQLVISTEGTRGMPPHVALATAAAFAAALAPAPPPPPPLPAHFGLPLVITTASLGFSIGPDWEKKVQTASVGDSRSRKPAPYEFWRKRLNSGCFPPGGHQFPAVAATLFVMQEPLLPHCPLCWTAYGGGE